MGDERQAGPFAGRLITLTGGAGGIGRAAARVFLDRGARVHLVDVDADRLDAAAAGLDAPGRVVTSVSTLESPADCARALTEGGGPSFALVHLAGIFEPDDPAGGDNAQYRRVLDANLTDGYDVAGAWRAHADTGAGPARVVFTSSLAFNRGAARYVAYSAAKGGLVGMTRALARRWAPDVMVNAVAPGIILTGMPDPVIAERRDQLIAEIPVGRFGEPEEVATVIAFLCGPDASYVNGQLINVDGGTIMSG